MHLQYKLIDKFRHFLTIIIFVVTIQLSKVFSNIFHILLLFLLFICLHRCISTMASNYSFQVSSTDVSLLSSVTKKQPYKIYFLFITIDDATILDKIIYSISRPTPNMVTLGLLKEHIIKISTSSYVNSSR